MSAEAADTQSIPVAAANAPKEMTTVKEQRQQDLKIRKELTIATYIRALNRGFLTPLYDFFMKWAARESVFRPKLVRQAGISWQQRVLDVGCGTATLTILIKKSQPEAEVVGLDADSAILEIAASKAATAGVESRLT